MSKIKRVIFINVLAALVTAAYCVFTHRYSGKSIANVGVVVGLLVVAIGFIIKNDAGYGNENNRYGAESVRDTMQGFWAGLLVVFSGICWIVLTISAALYFNK
ncbi:hypothetical protein [Jeongeupia naejangsanensis]|uniref:Uncharacterized protein n=1 Tax=Jeongeupia naejangsanensis TaxID=613195 RepID=A0ABS2BQG2_9NEIS|nr:hypothetical protein [Jeongeupia naejangsanensis]MBM3117867.1 hypothetical protein [Jeongeupia naejangsanensis]